MAVLLQITVVSVIKDQVHNILTRSDDCDLSGKQHLSGTQHSTKDLSENNSLPQ